MSRITCNIIVCTVLALLLPLSALAQITTGTVTGRVVDTSGAVVPGARVILISEARGTRTAPISTNDTGDYVFPNVAPDTYTVEVAASSFKTTRRPGIVITGGDRVGVPPLMLEVGGAAETVTVTAEAALVQTQSGERSFAIETKQLEALPVTHGNFTSVVALTPGVNGADNTSAGGTRLGGMSQNNIMMDGISAMDTGNNGQMLQMNIESIGEVKVLTQGYQAEYGRSSGLQITAYTKSGTNQFHGSGYGLFTDSDWNNNSWASQMNGDPKTKTDSQIFGYTIGGPVVIPKLLNGRNKLFFFYAHEYRPTTSMTNTGNPVRLRLPSADERAGDYSQSRDQNGALLTSINDPTTRQPFPGKIIPPDRLYAPGVRLLNRYPLPNVTQLPGMNYNYQMNPVSYNNLTQQPAFRIDYQVTSKLRASGKYSGQRARAQTTPGTIPGFNDTYNPYPYITNWAFTGTYMIGPTTFMEATYGFIRNQLGSPPISERANRLKELPDFPMLYPDAGVLDSRYYEYRALQDIKPPFWDGKRINLPPTFGWGSRIATASSPPNQSYPGFLNLNRTQDISFTLTHIMGRHTIKAGAYLNHSYKAQNVGSGGGIANVNFQGYVNFGNDTNNTLDTGYGFSNAALGVFTQFMQASRLVEGNMVYNQLEFFLQDNWKVTNRLTVDYGMRFVNQGPQYDLFGQESNFFPDQWKMSAAPVLYVAGCKSGATVCPSGNDRNAMDPRTGEILVIPGMANTQAAIGTPVPGTTNPMNGVKAAGDGISDKNYVWPKVVFGPRVGFAYDLTGNSNWVLRGGAGLFYDRPDGNTVFGIPGNPPMATVQDLRNGQLATLGQGLSMQPVPALSSFQYNAKIPSSVQWQAGFQRSLPWQMVGDVMYVGNYGYNRLSTFQGVNTQNLNAVDFGAAYLPQNQDPTLGTSAIPGATAYTTNLLRPLRGFGLIQEQRFAFGDTYHSMQFSLNRRFANGLSFGVNETWGISLKGNTRLLQRFQHAADGTISLRADWPQYQKLMEKQDAVPHLIKANAVWNIPGVLGMGSVLRHLTRDWQLASVMTFRSGGAYDLAYSYTSNGTNVNLTGSPDYPARMVILNPNALGSGCSGNQYGQFNYQAVTGPTYGSLGMESGRNYLRGCWARQVDLSVVRRIRFVGGEKYRLELRADLFNAFNTAQINARSTTATFNNPTSMTLSNNQYNADGSLNPDRLTPRNAGFGAATGAATMRNIQLQLRLQF